MWFVGKIQCGTASKIGTRFLQCRRQWLHRPPWLLCLTNWRASVEMYYRSSSVHTEQNLSKMTCGQNVLPLRAHMLLLTCCQMRPTYVCCCLHLLSSSVAWKRTWYTLYRCRCQRACAACRQWPIARNFVTEGNAHCSRLLYTLI